MKKAFDDLKGRTVEQLVAEFKDAGIEQSHAELYGKISKYNRLFHRMVAIQTELKNRPGDQRSALVPLLEHPNPQVRWMAAECLLAVAPLASRQVLKELDERNIYPQAADARGTLWALERGTRKPE
ncbi:MAG: hypothetical protein OJF62_003126 [Pseudolabrys sp.]|jgi:hypothetical protein|nr:hypothetical protein [Pseudolabrys sp.]